MLSQLPLVNAVLNATAAALLITGYILIRRRRELAHKRVMLTAFGVSVLFLASYLTYHLGHKAATPFTGQGLIRPVYFAILISHIILAAAVPVLAIITIALGLAGRRQTHRRWARWTLPIWLYVSVTGVMIYVLLYHLYPQT